MTLHEVFQQQVYMKGACHYTTLALRMAYSANTKSFFEVKR